MRVRENSVRKTRVRDWKILGFGYSSRSINDFTFMHSNSTKTNKWSFFLFFFEYPTRRIRVVFTGKQRFSTSRRRFFACIFERIKNTLEPSSSGPRITVIGRRIVTIYGTINREKKSQLSNWVTAVRPAAGIPVEIFVIKVNGKKKKEKSPCARCII